MLNCYLAVNFPKLTPQSQFSTFPGGVDHWGQTHIPVYFYPGVHCRLLSSREIGMGSLHG